MPFFTFLRISFILFLHSIYISNGSDPPSHDLSPKAMQTLYSRSLKMRNQVEHSPSVLPEPNAFLVQGAKSDDSIPSYFPRSQNSDTVRSFFSRSQFTETDPLEKTSRNSHQRLEARSSPRGFFERRSIFSSGILNRPMVSSWNQRVKNSFSNVFSSILPSHNPNSFQTPQASSNFAFSVPFHQQHHQSGFPFMNLPMPSNQPFNGMPTFPPYGQPQFMPYQPNLNMGPGLMTSGSALMPQRFPPPVNHNFLNYIKTVPKHTPLFNEAGGLKGAALEINNAFADFTDSSEHGPEVTQKFGSVGHTISTFLNMMGLGPAGGITDDIGALGRGGDWASMDNTPVARSSLDFYPGYGNQANLDEIGDFPIFFADITEEFLKKMNLTDVLEKVKGDNMSGAKEGKVENKKQSSQQEVDHSQKAKVMASAEETKPLKIDNTFRGSKTPTMSGPYHIPAPVMEIKTMTSVKKEQKNASKHPHSGELGKKATINKIPAMDNKIQSANKTHNKESSTSDTPPVSYKMMPHANNTDGKGQNAPSVHYKIPPVFMPVSPKDRKKPIAVYKITAPEFPHEKNQKASESLSYAPAHPLPDRETEMNENKLINDDVVRQWVPITEGKNYVEKHPKPIIDLVEHPKGLTILKEVLSDSKSHSWAM